MTTSAATTTAPYAELAAVVRGDLIMPGDPGYDQARAVYNAMIDKYPAAITRCRDTADVIACVRFAREHGIAIAVRGGGHNAAGLGVADDALVIDLSMLRSTTVNPENRTTASESSHSDLFWALRGGGGNFGVVTSFTFRCHDIGEHGTIIGGPVLYDIADTAEVMRWYRELVPSLPEELSGWIGLLTIPPAPPFPEELWGRKACGIVWCYTGPHDRADQVLEPVKTYGSPLLVGLQAMPFSVLQSAFDALYPAGLQWYWRADFFHEISDAAIEVHIKYGAELPTGHSTMHMYPIDGAASRVPTDATAFAYRDGGWAASSWGWTLTPPTPAASRNGRGTTGRICTRPRPAAPTSTS